MTRRVEQAPQNGPAQHLISRINYLGNLLKHLPESLPLDPIESHYHFGLATLDVEEEGGWFAFNRNLEACFETHKIAAGGEIVFRERGSKLSKGNLAGTSHQICGATRSKDPTKVSNSSELFCLNIKSHYRGKKRPAETNDIVKTPHPKRRANNKNVCDPQPVLVIDSDDDMGVQSGNDGPKRSLIDIQISEWPRSPDARLNGPKATRQAAFEDLNWVPKILATEDEKQAQWRKAAERERA